MGALSDTQTLLNDFIVPMFAENKTVKLFIDVENVTLKLFSFLKIPDLKMHKVLSCRATNTTQPKDIPSKYCNPSSEIASKMNTLDFMDLSWRLEPGLQDFVYRHSEHSEYIDNCCVRLLSFLL